MDYFGGGGGRGAHIGWTNFRGATAHPAPLFLHPWEIACDSILFVNHSYILIHFNGSFKFGNGVLLGKAACFQ